jgi:Ni2+-binding GTPase involved in maturation of urease and hydrogenase
VAVVANDQGHDLVDTAAFRSQGLRTGEITGGCFCCRFDELLSEADRLLAEHPVDVLLAEAVGSCTDLVATVYRPLRRFFPDRFRLAPFTVLVEPDRLHEMTRGDVLVPEDIVYLFGRQIAEAELLVLSKSDLVSPGHMAALRSRLAEIAPGVALLETSAVTGAGVGAWVDRLLGETAAADGSLDVDYDAYARGEAALGWLNATVALRRSSGLFPREVGETLMEEIGGRARRDGSFLPHAKVLVASSQGSARLSLTNAQGPASWSGNPDLAPEPELSAIINARMVAEPVALRGLIEDALATSSRRLQAELTLERLESFSPPRPVPRHRLPAPGQPAPGRA